MKKIIILSCLLTVFVDLFGQMPFSTYVRPSTELVKEKYLKKHGVSITETNDKLIDFLTKENIRLNTTITDQNTAEVKSQTQINTSSIKALQSSNDKLVESLIEEELSKPDFLDHMNANIVTLQNGKKMFPTINGEVINYKLSLWKDKRRHYLPISLFTKVSGNYSDSAAGASDDATSYFGAPLTLRFSPAFEIPFKNLKENKLFIGLNTDMRLLTIGDTIKNKFQTTWGVYGSVGISYMGRGYAYDGQDDIDEANRHDGTWSFTAMLYFFKSGGDYNKAIFGNYEKKTLTGIELLLRFKTSKKEDSKFNFLIGASNCFTPGTANTGGWQFRLGIGS